MTGHTLRTARTYFEIYFIKSVRQTNQTHEQTNRQIDGLMDGWREGHADTHDIRFQFAHKDERTVLFN